VARVAESSGGQKESQKDLNDEKKPTEMPWIASSNHSYSVLVQEISVDLN
jgi:hypothetical protein